MAASKISLPAILPARPNEISELTTPFSSALSQEGFWPHAFAVGKAVDINCNC